MPITYVIDPERGRLDMAVEGEFTSEEMCSVMRAIIASSSLPDGFTALSDHTGVRRAISASQLIALVAIMEQSPERFASARWAIVSTRPASYGMMRVLAARAHLALGMRVGIFFDARRAAEWLDEPREDGLER
jgi:hypothetical protein